MLEPVYGCRMAAFKRGSCFGDHMLCQTLTMWEISTLAETKHGTCYGLDGQLCGVIAIWWQTKIKNCTAQDAKVARALKFPGTCNAPTFETTASLLRAMLSASSNNSATALQSAKSHPLVQ